jgi:hypothetical protein
MICRNQPAENAVRKRKSFYFYFIVCRKQPLEDVKYLTGSDRIIIIIVIKMWMHHDVQGATRGGRGALKERSEFGARLAGGAQETRRQK